MVSGEEFFNEVGKGCLIFVVVIVLLTLTVKSCFFSEEEKVDDDINIIRTSTPIRPDMEIRFRNGVADTTYVYKGVE